MYDYVATSHEFIPILELKLNHSWIQWITTTRLFLKLVAPRATDKVGMGKVMGYVEHVAVLLRVFMCHVLTIPSIAKEIVAEKFAMKEKFGSSSEGEAKDMIDSFIEKGLTQEEAEAESLLQM